MAPTDWKKAMNFCHKGQRKERVLHGPTLWLILGNNRDPVLHNWFDIKGGETHRNGNKDGGIRQ